MPLLNKMMIAVASGTLTLGVAGAAFWFMLYGPGYYGDLEEIRARFEAIPGVEILEVHGHDDTTYEISGFTIELEGKGVIDFGAVDLDSFEHTDHLFLHSIGGRELIVVQEGYMGVWSTRTGEPVWTTGWANSIDVGPGGPFAELFPFTLTCVQDVLDHFEELCAELDTWPVQPGYARLEDEDGSRYYYSVKDPELGEDWIAPKELEPGSAGTQDR